MYIRGFKVQPDEILHVSCFDTNRQRKLQTELETKMIMSNNQFQDEEKHWICTNEHSLKR